MKLATQSITIEGQTYTADDILSSESPAFAQRSDFHNQLYLFLKEWFAPSPHLLLRTSGSTGKPKEWPAEKTRMAKSARLTCNHLGLCTGDKALLCLSLDYIAGKMMVVRALAAGLDLYPEPPSSNPLQNRLEHFHLAAMVPLQVHTCLQQPKTLATLKNIDNLLIGGGPVDAGLSAMLKDFPKTVYATYGMTETLSHIALRRLNNNNGSGYVPFSGVCLWLSAEGTLMIHAPAVYPDILETNDLATIHNDGTFSILGRKDNVVNSGGMKIQIEEVEEYLNSVLDVPFALSSCPDSKLGEMLVLVCEQPVDAQLIANTLEPYMRPKRIIQVAQLPRTQASGKIDRQALKIMVCAQLVTT